MSIEFYLFWKSCLYLCAKLLQLCSTFCDPLDYSSPVSSVHGILQARILEWVAVPSTKGSFQPKDWTHISYISCIGRLVLYQLLPPWEVQWKSCTYVKHIYSFNINESKEWDGRGFVDRYFNSSILGDVWYFFISIFNVILKLKSFYLYPFLISIVQIQNYNNYKFESLCFLIVWFG